MSAAFTCLDWCSIDRLHELDWLHESGSILGQLRSNGAGTISTAC